MAEAIGHLDGVESATVESVKVPSLTVNVVMKAGKTLTKEALEAHFQGGLTVNSLSRKN